MKKFLIISAIFAAAILAASCNDKELEVDESFDGEVTFSSSISTRAIDSFWEVNDAIGVYMNETGGTLGALGVNAEYVTEGGNGNFSSADPLYYPESGNVDFLAYYPYVDNASFNATSYGVDVSSQTDIAAIDLMVATATDVERSETAVKMDFDHKLASVVITVTVGDGWSLSDLVGTEVKLTGTDTEATYNLATDAIKLGGSYDDITLNAAANGQSAEGIVIPQTLDNAKFELTTASSGTFEFDVNTTKFEVGTQYSYEVMIDATGLTLINATISSWKQEEGLLGSTGDDGVTITLDQLSLILLEGETATLVATVSPEGTEVVWTSSNEDAVTVDQDGVVTGVAIGSAFVYATAGGEIANCVVAVQEDVANKEYPSLEGSEYYPIILDDYSYEELGDRIVYDFRSDDVTNFLYIWDETYLAATTSGLNSYGNDGGYLALTVGTSGWSGLCCLANDGTEAEALWNSIQANPTDYYLHLAMKSTSNYSHCFYILGVEGAAAKIGVGPSAVYDATVMYDFTRDGEWQEIEICMTELNLDGFTPATDGGGINVLVVLTEGTYGADLNLDAVFIYKK